MKQRELNPLRRVRKFFQVSLPTRLSKKFGIAEGEYVEMQETREGILVKPVQVSHRMPQARLSAQEQKILIRAKQKIATIKKNLLHSQGLSEKEVKVAIKVGLIDSHQAWWWLESWQKNERLAQKELKEGKIKEFESIEDLINDLHS